MAIVKHIKSRNANYSAAINYLLFEHDEKTGKKIVDESGRSILSPFLQDSGTKKCLSGTFIDSKVPNRHYCLTISCS